MHQQVLLSPALLRQLLHHFQPPQGLSPPWLSSDLPLRSWLHPLPQLNSDLLHRFLRHPPPLLDAVNPLPQRYLHCPLSMVNPRPLLLSSRLQQLADAAALKRPVVL